MTDLMDASADRAHRTLVTGLRFPEAPRWHGGKLWYLEIPAHRLHVIDADGKDVVFAEFADRPASFDFMPDGTLMVAFGLLRKIRRLDGSDYADLSALTHKGTEFEKFGDMVIDARGRIYVGCVADRSTPERAAQSEDVIALIDETGAVSVVASGVKRPNGMAITPDRKRLIAGESLANRLAQWDIEADGSLSNQRVFAETGDNIPDGICIDEEGAVWVTGVHSRQTVRILEGGRVADAIPTEKSRFAIATMLGGEDRRDLYVVTCSTPNDELKGIPDVMVAEGFVEVARVDVPGSGWPGN